MKARAAYGSCEALGAQADVTRPPAPNAAKGDFETPGTHPADASLSTRARRRRQLVRLADVVGLSNNDLRSNLPDDEKIRNVERELKARLARRGGRLVVKRTLDVVGAAFALVLLLPLLALAAFAVRLTTPGPVIYSQLRHGLNGRPFRIYKFRTFYVDHCDESGIRQAIPGDRRVTPIGQLFRRTNIDELPQLWNVLTGDMSLVGPRPHAIGMHAGGSKYEQLVRVYPMRLLVKPGITGLAQLRGFRGPTWNPVQARMRIACDLQYVAESSNLLDLKILVLTLLQELRGGTGG